MIDEDNTELYGEEYLRCDCCHKMVVHVDIRAQMIGDEQVVFTCVECLEDLYNDR